MLTFKYERKLFKQGFKIIAGVDEAGRGPLAGPLVAAAVIFPPECSLKGLDDSKKLSPQKRNYLFPRIKKTAQAVGICIVSHKMIDTIGIGKANRLAMQKAVERLNVAPDIVLLDGGRSRINSSGAQMAITRGDAKAASIAAASIIAKVTRDRIMQGYHRKFPKYGFNKHKGYGTREHMEKIRLLGPCQIHRRSFAPLSVKINVA